jgi:hypothetical protein
MLVAILMLAPLTGCLREAGARPDSPAITEEKSKDPSPKPPEAPVVEQGKTGKPVKPTADDVARKMADFVKEIEGLKPIAKPVTCEKLATFLPKAPKDYTAGKPHSEMIDTEPSVSGEESYPIRYNFVETRYKNGDKSVKVQILDTGNNHSFYKWIAEAAELMGGTEDDYEKGILLDGDFAMESYRKSSQRCELTVMVARRFQIEIIGNGVTPDFAQAVLKSIDRKALAALK